MAVFRVPHTKADREDFFWFEQDELPALSERSQLVLRLRSGMEDGKQHSLLEVGRRIGVGRERARQLQNMALRDIRRNRPSAARGYFAPPSSNSPIPRSAD